jgi:Flp pilus assembly pilin Flp
MNLFRRKTSPSVLSDERGLSTVEYVIILVLIAAAGVGLWKMFGETVKGKITGATETIDREVQIDTK